MDELFPGLGQAEAPPIAAGAIEILEKVLVARERAVAGKAGNRVTILVLVARPLRRVERA
jgi:hypothetical protein